MVDVSSYETVGMLREGGVDEGLRAQASKDHLAGKGSLTFPRRKPRLGEGALDLQVGGGRFPLELS